MEKKICIFMKVALTALSASSVAMAATQKLSVDSGSTTFLAVGRPSLLKIHGEGSGPRGELTVENGTVQGSLEMDLQTLKTGVEMRDDHMKNKYLEVGKYPKAVLKVSGIKMPPMDQLPKELPFEGTLTLHGETQPIKSGKVTLSKDGEKIKFTAKFQTSIPEFKIEIPSYAGIKVAENVDVEVNSTAIPVAQGKQASAE